MTEVEAAQKALREATQREAKGLEQLRRAQSAYQLLQDATREAWVAVRDARWRADHATPTPTPLPTPTPMGTTAHARTPYDLLADIDRQALKAQRREEKNK